MNRPPNKSVETNRRPATSSHARRHFGSALCVPPSLSAAVAHLHRYVKAPTTVITLLLLCGCHTPPRGAPADLGEGFRREGHPAFTPQEQAVVMAALRGVEQSCGRRLDAYFSVRPTAEGFSVHVLEVHRYEGKQPRFTMNRDWFVNVTADSRVISIWKNNK